MGLIIQQITNELERGSADIIAYFAKENIFLDIDGDLMRIDGIMS